MKIHDKIHGFTLNREEIIEEVNGVARVFEHDQTRARLIYISNDDDNKVFQIGFKTPSKNSTGVAHILEHSVLCGSRKYPVKEPFVELAKGSMNTFLNAMTYPDKTVYPIASTNEKDFMNLMDVYMDAVFYPEIYNIPYIFHQEGWHYHLENKEDPITYNGVVYNEMKGVYSSPEEILHHHIFETLYPDTIYGEESGGDPDFIPDLSYEDFVGFHKKFYHPSNAYIYLYGDGDIEEHLKYLNDSYLSQFDYQVIDNTIETQLPFEETAYSSISYPVAGEDGQDEKSYLAMGYVLENEPTFEDLLAFDVLGHILLSANSAPLKKALLDLNICKDVDYSYSSSLKQPYFAIVLKNTEEKYRDLFVETVDKTLSDLVKNGLDKRSVEAGININEFSLIEGEYGSYPKGLMYGLEMMDTWLYGGDPLSHLKYRDAIEKLRQSSENRGFEALIARYLLYNSHRAVVSIHPDENLAQEREHLLIEKLDAYKKSLTPQALDHLVSETQALIERQNSEDSEDALMTIPKLSLDEINKKARQLVLEEEMYKGHKLLWHPGCSGGIIYTRFYFDTHTVPQDDLKYLSLVNKIIGRVSTKDYNDERLNQEIEIKTGGISSSIETYDDVKKPEKYESKFIIKGKAIGSNVAKMMELIESMVLRSCFDEKNLIADIISEIRLTKENQFLTAGHTVTVQRMQSYYSQSARMFEELSGIEFYKFIVDLDENLNERWEFLSSKMADVAKAVFNRNGLIISITGDENLKELTLNEVDRFVENLENREAQNYNYHFDLEKLNEGFMTASQIQYVSKGYNIEKLGYAYHGSYLVLKSILGMDYLWNRIRVQGGAYGAFFGINRVGDLYFASYRDPNLLKTIDAYNEASEYIEQLDIPRREMEKYIIGTISSKDVPLSTAIKGEVADTMYFNGLSSEDVQKERDEILGTTLENLKEAAQMVKKAMDQTVICVIGSEESVRQAEAVFKEVKYIK
ncbi:MAG: insulinase family protein [Eubacterium sp.]